MLSCGIAHDHNNMLAIVQSSLKLMRSTLPAKIELYTDLARTVPDIEMDPGQVSQMLLTKRDGLSCKDAAKRMGTTEGSVRVYVCEARARLKILLKQRA